MAGGSDAETRAAETIGFAGFTLDLAGQVLIDRTGHDVRLTRGEFAILATLVQARGRVLSRGFLIEAVSGRSCDVFDRSIDNLIVRLRRKIEPNAKRPEFIHTVRGLGYKIAPRSSPPSGIGQRSPVIRVMPFTDLDGYPTLAHACVAITTNLETELPRFVGGGAGSPRQGGARYILRGIARRRGNDVRVDAQMTEAETATPVWADRFDGKLNNLFAFEREVSTRIARGVDLAFTDTESRRLAVVDHPHDPIDWVMRGNASLYRPRTPKNLAQARRFFEQALKIDPQLAEALAGLAHAHISDTLCRWSTDPSAQVRLSESAVCRAIEINPRLAMAYHVRGLVWRVQRQHERALAAFEHAVQLNPSLAPAHAEIGFMRQESRGDLTNSLVLLRHKLRCVLREVMRAQQGHLDRVWR